MTDCDGLLRAQAIEELTRLILAEVSLLAHKYRYVRRHHIPHIQELVGLLDVLWQEVEMVNATPGGLLDSPRHVADGQG